MCLYLIKIIIKHKITKKKNIILNKMTQEENEKYLQKTQDKANNILNQFKGYEIQEALSVLEVTKRKLESLQRRTII